MNNEIAAEPLAVRIKRLRIASGLTQGQLAELLGISQAAVARWETGELLSKGQYVVSLAGALGIGLGELLAPTKLVEELAR